MTGQRKILFIAFACEPERGSEPGVGWNNVRAAARWGPVWVITDPLHRNAMEAWLARNDEQNIHAVYHALPGWLQWMWKSSATLNLYYYLWHIGAARLARRLNQIHRFDVVHHVSYVRYWMPSAAAEVGIPFVWGPVGGGETAPKGFLRGASLKSRAGEWIRSIMRWIFERDPRLKRCAQNANVVIASSKESAQCLQRMGVRNVRVMSCIGMHPGATTVTATRTDNVFRFISVGRILHWKGFHFGLEAFAKANLPNAQYVVVGEGPDLNRLKRLARRLGIADRVVFTGALNWHDTQKQFQQTDVLVHPSLHDSGGFVLLEAMELSKPVICLDLGGPALHVNGQNGFSIPAQTVEQAISGIADAMSRLAGDPSLCAALGRNARQRAIEEFSWEHKSRVYQSIYDEVTGAVARDPSLAEEGET